MATSPAIASMPRWNSSLRWAPSLATRHLGGVALELFGHRSKLRTTHQSNFPLFTTHCFRRAPSSVAGAMPSISC